jgi:hypothetical protein
MMRYLGSIIGTGVLGAVLNTDAAAPDISVFRVIFAVVVAMAVLALVCSLLVHRFPDERMLAPQGAPSGDTAGVGVPGS